MKYKKISIAQLQFKNCIVYTNSHQIPYKLKLSKKIPPFWWLIVNYCHLYSPFTIVFLKIQYISNPKTAMKISHLSGDPNPPHSAWSNRLVSQSVLQLETVRWWILVLAAILSWQYHTVAFQCPISSHTYQATVVTVFVLTFIAELLENKYHLSWARFFTPGGTLFLQ